MRRRVAVLFEAGRGWFVNLPTYSMVPHSFLPAIAGKVDVDGVLAGAALTDDELAQLSCEVDIPDSFIDEADGLISRKKLATMYEGSAFALALKDGLRVDVRGAPPVSKP